MPRTDLLDVARVLALMPGDDPGDRMHRRESRPPVRGRCLVCRRPSWVDYCDSCCPPTVLLPGDMGRCGHPAAEEDAARRGGTFRPAEVW